MRDLLKAFIKQKCSKEQMESAFQEIVQSRITIYVILFFAYFHAILRLSPTSSITLFRLLIPLSIYIIAKRFPKVFFGMMFGMIGVVVINFIQFMLCKKVFFTGVQFSFSNLILFWVHVFSIFVFVGLMICLWQIERKRFIKNYIVFNRTIIKIAVMLDTVFLLCGGFYKDFALFGNINDFGCAIVAGLIIILCGKEQWWSKCFWSVCILALLYVNDSKFALLGALLAIVIYLVIKTDEVVVKKLIDEKNRKFDYFLQGKKCQHAVYTVLKKWRLIAFSGCVVILLIVLISPITINGYPIRQMVWSAVVQMATGTFYEDSNQSLLFRVNAIIGMGTILKKSFLCGVGVGNTGVILRAILPGMTEMFPDYSYVSPHVWWMELFADFGLVFIVPAIVLFVYQVKRFFTNQYKDRASVLQTMTLLSFPVWCMSSAGLYTEYFTLSLLTVAIFSSIRRFRHHSRKNERKES